MEIKLNKPHQFLDKSVEIAAMNAGCWARVKHWTSISARFTLQATPGSEVPASFEAHDAIIKSLLDIYPDARIRTARATFEGKADWEAQKQARVA